MEKLKKGMQVKVFEDPITCEKLEGVFTLKQDQEIKGCHNKYWKVSDSDGYPFYRWINPDNH